MDVEELRRRLGLLNSEITLSPCERVNEQSRGDLKIRPHQEFPIGPSHVPIGETANAVVLRSVVKPKQISIAVETSNLHFRSQTQAKRDKEKKR